MARKRKKGGTGSVVTLRRMKGVGNLRNPKTFAGATVPPLLGGGVTGIATIATRYWAKPSEGDQPKMLYKWAPAVGLGGGILTSVALYWLGGAPAMLSSLVSSLITFAGFTAHDQVVRNQLGEFALALPATAAEGAGQSNGAVEGLGVVVPRRIAGTGAMMLESTSSRDPYQRYGVHGTGAAYGQEVSLAGTGRGMDASAFGRTHLGR